MLKTSHFLFSAVLAGVLSLSALLPAYSSAQTTNNAAGAVFVMTNAADKNEIISYKRSADGSLEQGRSFRTDGRGSGGVTDPLGSQGSLTLSEDHSLLFAVNAGSGDISVFRVHGKNLSLVDKVACGGSEPVAWRNTQIWSTW
jgi:6-phosphogluconolactonase